MKKILFFAFLSLTVLTTYNLYAEDAQTAVSEPEAQPIVEAVPVPAETPAPAAPAEPQAAAQDAPAPEAAPVETPAQAPVVSPVAEEAINTENLEFISGEVTAADEAAKTVTIKLYGETEADANQKILTVKVDETTDITDGEKDRDTKSLSPGTEVDVEYDPASSKATYIFVY
jgi:predicted lipid-binding transport protein (Tim44 family)